MNSPSQDSRGTFLVSSDSKGPNMPDYSRNEIVDILLSLGACHGRYRAAARYYRQHYPRRLQYPNHVRIRFIEQRERHRQGIRRNRRRIMTQNNDDPRIVVVLAMVDLDHHISLREIQRRIGIPRSTASRILRLHRFHPYHITLTQALVPDDARRRLNFCNWAQARIRLRRVDRDIKSRKIIVIFFL